MNQNFNQLQVRFPGLGCWVFVLISFWIIGAIGITGLLKATFALILFLFLAPVVAFLGLQFWVKRNLVQGDCPVCEQPLTSLKSAKIACPNCGAEVSVVDGEFVRAAGEGIIDVQAVDVRSAAVTVNEEADAATVIDVEVQRLPEAES